MTNPSPGVGGQFFWIAAGVVAGNNPVLLRFPEERFLQRKLAPRGCRGTHAVWVFFSRTVYRIRPGQAANQSYRIVIYPSPRMSCLFPPEEVLMVSNKTSSGGGGPNLLFSPGKGFSVARKPSPGVGGLKMLKNYACRTTVLSVELSDFLMMTLSYTDERSKIVQKGCEMASNFVNKRSKRVQNVHFDKIRARS